MNMQVTVKQPGPMPGPFLAVSATMEDMDDPQIANHNRLVQSPQNCHIMNGRNRCGMERVNEEVSVLLHCTIEYFAQACCQKRLHYQKFSTI